MRRRPHADRAWVRVTLVRDWTSTTVARRGCRRVWLVTTNDNLGAIAFYQHLGMDLRALHRHAVRSSRQVKPTTPLRDGAGFPIGHELEFEIILGE